MKKAFTLIELMIVLAVIVVILGVGLGGMINSQRQMLFLSSYENVLLLVRDQRSLALAGKALPDYTDYDNDGCKAPPTVANSPSCANGSTYVDLVTPANYGISFDLASTAMTVTTFADLHTGTDSSQVEGVYNPPAPIVFYKYTSGSGSDIAMSQYKLDSRLKLVSNLAPATRVDIFYSPIFGDVTISPALGTNKFLIFGVWDQQRGVKKCSKIHPVAGVPEVAAETEC